MSENEVIEHEEPERRLDKVKEVVKKIDWKSFTVGVVLTSVTFVVAKRVMPNKTGIMIKKMVIKDSVFLIETFERRMGPPSYLVECLETGEKWISQLDLAKTLGVSKSLVSSRFADGNGQVAIIDDKHYVRRAMAIPNSG